MRAQRKRSGFTMAEMLIVVAIIAVLGAVSFVAVTRYQRSLAQLERDGIAKEIFVAAQNHLTMAENEGYLGNTGFGSREADGSDVYYFAVNRGNAFGADTVLDLMLPFGAVDEFVRTGGSYIIRYQASPALVLDVFYCSAPGTRFGRDLSGDTYTDVLAYGNSGRKADRRSYGSGAVLGWYGGEEAAALASGQRLETPTFEIVNAEKLLVKVTDPNAAIGGASLRLIVTGASSGAKKAFTLTNFVDSRVSYDNINAVYTVTLDSVTDPGLHFAGLEAEASTGAFSPGEDIIIQAVAYNNTALTNIAYSDEKTVNSLFQSYDAAATTAFVNNLRHLENLDRLISNVNTATVDIRRAEQTTDLSWAEFEAGVGRINAPAGGGSAEGTSDGASGVSVYRYADPASRTAAGCFMPVTPGYALTYDGMGHNISGIRAEAEGNAGLFGALEDGGVANLALIDFDITATGDGGSAGALAGTATRAAVNNVLAYNSVDYAKYANVTAAGDGGSAGGLIGTVNGGSVTAGAAALYVRGTGDAGGLIGAAKDAAVSASYSGGHTLDGVYSDATGDVKGRVNVVSSGNAGGLIGAASGSTRIVYSYSTCSVSGETAGGLVGDASAEIRDCYAAGRVFGTDRGAFAGTLSGTAADCLYYESVNPSEDGGYLPALGSGASEDVEALDASAQAYESFVGAQADWARAWPYDDALSRHYGVLYPLKTVGQLGWNGDAGFAEVHYGDWPMPETLAVNVRE